MSKRNITTAERVILTSSCPRCGQPPAFWCLARSRGELTTDLAKRLHTARVNDAYTKGLLPLSAPSAERAEKMKFAGAVAAVALITGLHAQVSMLRQALEDHLEGNPVDFLSVLAATKETR